MEKPLLDSKADEYIGETFLRSVTYVDHEENLIGQRQWFGTIMTFDKRRGISIKI
jgi:hypothetical protein